MRLLARADGNHLSQPCVMAKRDSCLGGTLNVLASVFHNLMVGVVAANIGDDRDRSRTMRPVVPAGGDW